MKESFPPEPPESPKILPYFSPRDVRRRPSQGWQIAAGFGMFWGSVVLSILLLSQLSDAAGPAVIFCMVFLPFLCLSLCLIVGFQFEKWGYFKGFVAAFLLTVAMFGLLFCICFMK